jgi:tetratricopeptide (TPR) repeat protein
MWAHLALRLSRWEVATANCLKATALEREWFAVLGTRMTDYGLSSHHFDICFRALMHDGRYLEARKLAQEVYQAGSKGAIQFDKGRLHTLERDWEEVLRVGEDYKKSNNRNDGMYFIALALIGKGELVQAEAECKTLEEALKNPRHYRVLETRGLLLCATGRADEGLKLLQEAAQKSQNDYDLHAYGGGAYFMEAWGWAALAAQRFDDAEEAFYEALAHDTASARAAIGLQALMETRGRREEAQRYAQLAREFWRYADARLLDNELQRARSCANGVRVAQGVK